MTEKVAGIIIDGSIRDVDEIGQWDFPVYATGTTPGGPYKEGPGEVNVPVACGGISVNPGDIILGDPDGVIVIPRKDAAQILEDARKFQEADEKKLEAAKNGTANRAWWKRPWLQRNLRSSTAYTSHKSTYKTFLKADCGRFCKGSCRSLFLWFYMLKDIDFFSHLDYITNARTGAFVLPNS